jgi:hypothetical protein
MRSSETSVDLYLAIRQYNQEDLIFLANMISVIHQIISLDKKALQVRQTPDTSADEEERPFCPAGHSHIERRSLRRNTVFLNVEFTLLYAKFQLFTVISLDKLQCRLHLFK